MSTQQNTRRNAIIAIVIVISITSGIAIAILANPATNPFQPISGAFLQKEGTFLSEENVTSIIDDVYLNANEDGLSVIDLGYRGDYFDNVVAPKIGILDDFEDKFYPGGVLGTGDDIVNLRYNWDAGETPPIFSTTTPREATLGSEYYLDLINYDYKRNAGTGGFEWMYDNGNVLLPKMFEKEHIFIILGEYGVSRERLGYGNFYIRFENVEHFEFRWTISGTFLPEGQWIWTPTYAGSTGSSINYNFPDTQLAVFGFNQNAEAKVGDLVLIVYKEKAIVIPNNFFNQAIAINSLEFEKFHVIKPLTEMQTFEISQELETITL